MVLVFNKVNLQSFHTKKVWGRQTFKNHAKFAFPQSRERQRNSQAYLPDTKNMCLPSKFKQVNSAHYPRSWSLIISSLKKKYLHYHSKSQELSLYLGSTHISFRASTLHYELSCMLSCLICSTTLSGRYLN